jgi:hypothetical protein
VGKNEEKPLLIILVKADTDVGRENNHYQDKRTIEDDITRAEGVESEIRKAIGLEACSRGRARPI